MKLLHNVLLQRVLLFIVLFVMLSGVSGSWLISKQTLLFPFYFWIYGSAGKVLLFSIVSFLLMTKEKIFSIQIKSLSYLNFLVLCGSLASIILFFVSASLLLPYKQYSDVPLLTIFTHSLLWLSGLLACLAVFGYQFLVDVYRRFYRQIGISAILAVVFYFSFSYIFKLWPYLSSIVLWAVSHLLKLTEPSVIIVRPLTIQLSDFAVTIGEYCSGIESLFLISVLYVMIGCLEWERLRKGRYFLLFPLLIVGMFVLNIVRVYGIIQSGIWFSPQIAAKLFHTYLGMILFMTYFFLFWKWSAPILLKQEIKRKGK